MALNRYRLKHLAENQKHAGAILASRLLSKPDRLIGLILLGNNFVNIIITQLATFIGYRVFGDAGIAIATGFLTFALLIFAEVAPKTLAAMHPERFAFPAAFVYTPLLKIAYPLVWLINWFANGLLRLFSIPTGVLQSTALNQDELRSVVSEAKGLIHDSHQDMLLRVLDLEKITVEDIMVPRTEIIGIDLDEKWEDIEEQLRQVNYTRLPAYRGNINEVVGYLHMRRIMNLLANDRLTLGELEHTMRPAYFIPESTSLTQQLINFKKDRRRHAMVVDEYGDVQGLVTMEDLLGEIVGEFTSDAALSGDIIKQDDGSWMVDGSISVRDLNRSLEIKLPTDGPRTLSGLILEYLEAIPEARLSVLLAGYPLEVIKIVDNVVKTVRVAPRLPRSKETQNP
jgi:Mg2+/Co2+ transporter CorB